MVTIFLNVLIYISFYSLIIKCEDQCPRNKPIYNTLKNDCFLEYCNQSQFDDGTCIIANSYAKTKWINTITTISTSNNSQIFSNIAVDDKNQNMLIETDIDENRKLFFSMEKNGKGFNNEEQFFYLKNKENNFLYNNYYPQSYLATVNSHRMYYSFSSNESFFVYDLVSKNYTEDILENILGNKILSTYNSLMKLNEEDTLIYAYLTTEYKIVLQKIKLLSDGIEVIQTMKDENKTLPRNSCKCKYLARKIPFIECLIMDEEQIYSVRMYDKDLNFYKEYKFEKNNSPKDQAYYSFHDLIILNNKQSFFVIYTDNASKPFLYSRDLSGNNLTNIRTLSSKYSLFNSYDYNFANSENSMTKISDIYFVLATICEEKRHLMIIFFNFFDTNNKITLYLNYLDIPLKDLYDINYFSNIYAFSFNTFLGMGFIQEKNDQYINSFLLFGNSYNKTKIINNIFLNYQQDGDILYNERISDMVIIENNIFCYDLSSIKILSWPDINTGFEIRIMPGQRLINAVTSVTINQNISIYFSGNITEAKLGNYEIIYSPVIIESSTIRKYVDSFDNRELKGYDLIATISDRDWDPDEYPGKEAKIIFNVIKCYDVCLTCLEESNDEFNQKCKVCKPGYYFEENTSNCYDKPRKGYYFDKDLKIFRKCYDLCETCDDAKDVHKQHCLSCKSDYLLYPSTNCLGCKLNGLLVDYTQEICLDRIPVGYYLNDTEYNTIDKCHPNCGDCNQGPIGENMNCEYCDNLENFYSVENTSNCQYFPFEGYYLAENNKFRPCHPFCKNCTIGPNEESMNCDYCNNNLGYFKNGTDSKNCVFKEIEKMYYVEENDNYLPCYEDCLFCFDKEKNIIDDEGNNHFIMNCLTCNESDNFTLFEKTGKNCLNCKAQNKFVNFDQTDCINTIPEGYFLSNNDTKEIDQCYPLCKTCHEKGLNSKNMKCDSCNELEQYFLLDGNCVLTMTCPSFFYYKKNLILNNTDNPFSDGEKNCLNNKEECPYSFPFYLKNDLECNKSCSIDLILESKCFIANFEAGLNQIFNLIYDQYINEQLDFFEEFFSYIYNNKSDFIIKINFLEFDGEYESKSIILNDSIKRIDDWGNLNLQKNYEFQEQEINLEQCLEFLQIKNFSNNDTNKLIMTKIDIKNINLNISHYYIQLFMDNNEAQIQKIDLSPCNFNDINDTLILNINDLISQKKSTIPKHTDQNQEKENEEYEDGYSYEKFNGDKCAVTYNENGADIIVEDRLVKYNQQFYVNEEINPNNEALQARLLEENSKTFIQIPISEICPTNYDLIDFDFHSNNATCLNIFNFQEVLSDINITQFFEEKTYMNKTYIEIEVETNENKNQDNNGNSYTYTNSFIKPKTLTEVKSDANIKYMKCINNISKQFKKNYVLIILTILDIAYLICIVVYFAICRKKYLEMNEQKTNFGIIGLKGSYYNSYKLDQNLPKIREIRTYKKNMFSSVNSDIQSINNNYNNNINNRNKNIPNVKNKKTMISDELTNRQYNITSNNYNKNSKNKKENNNTDTKDYDLSEYSIALEKDKRNFSELFKSISKKKQIFIFAFKDDKFIKLLKISLIPFCLVNYFTTNVFFFTDKVIHQIYLDKGSYNFPYQIRIICLSALISSLFLYLGKYIFIVKKIDNKMPYIIKYINYAFVLIFLLFLFYWLYVGSYTSVFIKSQKHICLNFLLTFITCIIYELVLTIISVILRKIALNKKDRSALYKISIILILLKA